MTYLSDPMSSCGADNDSRSTSAEPPSPSTSASSASMQSVISTVTSSYMSSMRSALDKLDENGNMEIPDDIAEGAPPSNCSGGSEVSNGVDGHAGSRYREIPAGTQVWKVVEFEREVRRHILSNMLQDSGLDPRSPCKMVRRSRSPAAHLVLVLVLVLPTYASQVTYEEYMLSMMGMGTSARPAWKDIALACQEAHRQSPFELPPTNMRQRRKSPDKPLPQEPDQPARTIRPKLPPGSGSVLPLDLDMSIHSASSTSDVPHPSTTSAFFATATILPIALENIFYADLVRDIRKVAYQNDYEIDEQIRVALICIYTNVYDRGPCPPPISGICGTPVSCNGAIEDYSDAADAFVEFIMSMSDPYMVSVGMYGLRKDEVDAIRGIIFLRYVTGWYQEGVEAGEIIPVSQEYEGKGKGKANPEDP